MRTILRLTLVTFLLPALVLAPGCSRPDTSSRVTIKGSDTMVHLVKEWASAYKKQAPNVELIVTGGGSGTGVAALINGTTDICMSSRNINEKELAEAKSKGKDVKEVTVAMDGIAIAVHRSNPRTVITMAELKDIYTGKVSNWSELGGLDKPILALSRESSSGTYVFYQEHVLEKQDFHPNTRLMAATSAIIQGVQSDAGAIGYVGLGYAESAGDKVKILPVKADPDKPAVLPSIETVRNGDYAIARALFFYTPGEPQGIAKAFEDFCTSPAGQKIVEAQGYVSLN